MAFWGCVLKAGAKEKVKVSPAEVLHLSQVCMSQPNPGKCFLQVEVAGQTYAIAVLEKDKAESEQLDLFFGTDAPTFINSGKSELHLSGYTEPRELDEDMLEDDESEEEEKPVAAKKASPKAAPKASPKATPKASPKAKPAAAKPGKADDSEDDLEDEEEEEDEESEEEKPAAKGEKRKPEQAAAPPAKKAKEAPAPEKKGDKKGDKKAKEAPEPEKKGDKKGDKKAKDAAPAGGDAAENGYVKAVADYLKQHGKTKFSDLGSKVKRPDGVGKIKVVLGKHKDQFVVTDDAVELKK